MYTECDNDRIINNWHVGQEVARCHRVYCEALWKNCRKTSPFSPLSFKQYCKEKEDINWKLTEHKLQINRSAKFKE
jgi:hypothetical protein